MKKVAIFVGIFLAISILVAVAGCGNNISAKNPETARIGVMAGSVNHHLAQERYPNAEIFVYDNYNDSVSALLSDKVDFATMDLSSAQNVAKYNLNIEVIPEPLSDEVTAMALNKRNQKINKKICDIVDRYLSDGTIEEIIGHWQSIPGSDYTDYEAPKVEKGDKLRVAVTTHLEPRCFIKDGKISGMAVELVERIAYELDMSVEYIDMNFGEMMNSLVTDECDVAAAMYPTPERMEIADFTTGYLSNPQVLITKN